MADEVLRPNRLVRQRLFQPEGEEVLRINEDTQSPDGLALSAPVEFEFLEPVLTDLGDDTGDTETVRIRALLEVGFSAPVEAGPWEALRLRFVASRSRPPSPEAARALPAEAECLAGQICPESTHVYPNSDVETAAIHTQPLTKVTNQDWFPSPLWERVDDSFESPDGQLISTSVVSALDHELQISFEGPPNHMDGWHRVTSRIRARARGTSDLQDDSCIIGALGQAVTWTNNDVVSPPGSPQAPPPGPPITVGSDWVEMRNVALVTSGTGWEIGGAESTMLGAWEWGWPENPANTRRFYRTSGLTETNLEVGIRRKTDVVGPFTKLIVRVVLRRVATALTEENPFNLKLKIDGSLVECDPLPFASVDGVPIHDPGFGGFGVAPHQVATAQFTGEWTAEQLDTAIVVIEPSQMSDDLEVRSIGGIAITENAVDFDPETVLTDEISSVDIFGNLSSLGTVGSGWTGILPDLNSGTTGFFMNFQAPNAPGPFDRITIRTAADVQAGTGHEFSEDVVVLYDDEVSNEWTSEGTGFQAVAVGSHTGDTGYEESTAAGQVYETRPTQGPTSAVAVRYVSVQVVAKATTAEAAKAPIFVELTTQDSDYVTMGSWMNDRTSFRVQEGDYQVYTVSFQIPDVSIDVSEFEVGGYASLKIISGAAGQRIATAATKLYTSISSPIGCHLRMGLYTENDLENRRIVVVPDLRDDDFEEITSVGGSPPPVAKVIEHDYVGCWTRDDISRLRLRMFPGDGAIVRIHGMELILHSAGSAEATSLSPPPSPPPPPGLPPAPPAVDPFCDRLYVDGVTLGGWSDPMNVAASIAASTYTEDPTAHDSDNTFWSGSYTSGPISFSFVDPAPPFEGSWVKVVTRVVARSIGLGDALEITTTTDGGSTIISSPSEVINLSEDYKLYEFEYADNFTQEQVEGLEVTINPTLGVSPPPPGGIGVQLALAADESGSVSASEFALMMGAYADLVDGSGPNGQVIPYDGSVAICLVMFGSIARLAIDWTLIENQADADAFATAVRAVTPMNTSATNIAEAITTAHQAFTDGRPSEGVTAGGNPGWNMIIDVAGDGQQSSGNHAQVRLARDLFLADMGDQVNGIPIVTDPGSSTLPEYFEENVQGGLGSFTTPADGFDDFEATFAEKLALEIIQPTIRITAVGIEVCSNPPQLPFAVQFDPLDVSGNLLGSLECCDTWTGSGVFTSDIPSGQGTVKLYSPHSSIRTQVSLDGFTFSDSVDLNLIDNDSTGTSGTVVFYQIQLNQDTKTPSGVWTMPVGLSVRNLFLETVKGPYDVYPIQVEVEEGAITQVLKSNIFLVHRLKGTPALNDLGARAAEVSLTSNFQTYEVTWEGMLLEDEDVRAPQVNLLSFVPAGLQGDAPQIDIDTMELEFEPYCPGISPEIGQDLTQEIEDILIPFADIDSTGWEAVPLYSKLGNNPLEGSDEGVYATPPNTNSATFLLTSLSTLLPEQAAVSPVPTGAVRDFRTIKVRVAARDESEGSAKTRLRISTNFGYEQVTEQLTKDYLTYELQWTHSPGLTSDQLEDMTLTMVAEETLTTTQTSKVRVEAIRAIAVATDTFPAATEDSILLPPPPPQALDDGICSLTVDRDGEVEVFACGSTNTCGSGSPQNVSANVTVHNGRDSVATISVEASGSLTMNVIPSILSIAANSESTYSILAHVGSTYEPFPKVTETGIIQVTLECPTETPAILRPDETITDKNDTGWVLVDKTDNAANHIVILDSVTRPTVPSGDVIRTTSVDQITPATNDDEREQVFGFQNPDAIGIEFDHVGVVSFSIYIDATGDADVDSVLHVRLFVDGSWIDFPDIAQGDFPGGWAHVELEGDWHKTAFNNARVGLSMTFGDDQTDYWEIDAMYLELFERPVRVNIPWRYTGVEC